MNNAEYDACEDCLGTGGHRDQYGAGECGACGGTGRLPVNRAARTQELARQRRREDWAYEQAERDYDN